MLNLAVIVTSSFCGTSAKEHGSIEKPVPSKYDVFKSKVIGYGVGYFNLNSFVFVSPKTILPISKIYLHETGPSKGTGDP